MIRLLTEGGTIFLAIQKNAPISFLLTRCSTRNSPVYSVTEIIRNINVRFKRATSTLKLCASKFLICLYSAQKDGKKGELMKTYIIHMLITIALFFRFWYYSLHFLPIFLLLLTWNAFLSSLRHTMVGCGLPEAWHTKVASSPSLTVMSELVFSNWISGGTIEEMTSL